MDQCTRCGSILPLDAQFCGQCGSVIIKARNTQGNLGGYPQANILADDKPTTISKPSYTTMGYRNDQDNTETRLDWSQGELLQQTPNPDDDEEDERRRRTLMLGLPLSGAMADQPPAAGVPMIHGTPQIGGVPVVQGNPNVPLESFAAQGLPSAAPSFEPAAAPQTPAPATGPWSPAYPHTPTPTPAPRPPSPSSHPGPAPSGTGTRPAPGGPPCGVVVLILVVICLIIVGTIGGLFFGLPPAISISGSSTVAPGGVLHLHCNNFLPGSSITLILYYSIQLFHF